MSKYAHSFQRTFKFEDDTVSATLRPLELGDMLKMRSLPPDDPNASLLLAKDIVGRYVTITGLHDVAGSDVTIATVCAQVYFVSLLMEIYVELSKVSVPANP